MAASRRFLFDNHICPYHFCPYHPSRTHSSSAKTTVPDAVLRSWNPEDPQSIPGVSSVVGIPLPPAAQLHASAFYIAHTVASTSLCVKRCLRTFHFVLCFALDPFPSSRNCWRTTKNGMIAHLGTRCRRSSACGMCMIRRSVTSRDPGQCSPADSFPRATTVSDSRARAAMPRGGDKLYHTALCAPNHLRT